MLLGPATGHLIRNANFPDLLTQNSGNGTQQPLFSPLGYFDGCSNLKPTKVEQWFSTLTIY